MKHTQVLAFSMVLGLILIGSATPARSQDLSEAAIFATNSARIENGAQVESGSVVVNDFSPGPTLSTNGEELVVNKDALIAGDAIADSIQKHNTAIIGGSVECNALDSSGVSCGGLSLPVILTLPPFFTANIPGGAPDVTVARAETVSIDAGDYADIVVADGAPNGSIPGGKLIFTGGVYNIGSLLSKDRSTLEFAAPTELRIQGLFATGKDSTAGPTGSATAETIILYVAVTNLDPADPRSKPAAATVGGTFAGNIYAPNGTIVLGNASDSTGAYLGLDVWVEKNATVNVGTGFPRIDPPGPTPTAPT
ncbi:MAG: hypothetical protein V3T72_15470, partial [Thermoanaerobaculia bacterium]